MWYKFNSIQFDYGLTQEPETMIDSLNLFISFIGFTFVYDWSWVENWNKVWS